MRRFCLSLLMAVCAWVNAQAYDDLFRWGISAGGNISKADSDGQGFLNTGWRFDSSGGYYVGLSFKMGLPFPGWGIDGSLYYSQEMADISSNDCWFTDKLRSFNLPLHLRYDFEISDIEEAFVPFAFAGPQYCFKLNDFDWYRLFSKDPLSAESLHDPTLNVTADKLWKLDLGFGVVLGGRVQVAYTYVIPLNTAFRFQTVYDEARDNFKLGCHRIGMTYYF